MNPLSSTARTRLGRYPERSSSDRSVLYEILDNGMICHLGLIVNGSPRVIPTGYGRQDDTLYVHGSSGASSLRAGPSQEICITVTHLDGIVLARSLFHHSINYRSALIYGTPRLVSDTDEKLHSLRVITEQLAPGQWDVARRPTRKELAGVSVLALSLDEASVKVRQGPPSDDEPDYDLDVWAGVLPVHQTFGTPAPDPLLRPGIPVPGHIARRVTS
ncbi:pyridoxamine 5'-phosphate oxidase family protein [Actinomadura madurae]|uniref:pyridoxamine 5'-phosphate oxidase family protein n=1 Tax=Actinomadura madurae TaxID=1993 RepID=UPI002026DE83|nr:pyridoxamine 5'-phosphate oxidase family protein [Actinomadura madurae]URM95502.1 pyridoxamine 5'-phosphate oxidase family protein [Actinomadura madurae]URN06194.1 pyridoxamine 5'-phosphate oxidase family protein [Actinomadura madurae]